MTASEVFKNLIHPRREAFPNLSKLAAISLTIPVTSVECERGISRLNYIKCDQRATLSITNLNMLLMLALESKPLHYFDFDSAFEIWMMKKDRRGLRKLNV